MLELVSLEFSGIRRFVDPQRIDFSNLGKLVQIDGDNKNTGGSSGAGKTTVFLALDYLLGISDIPSTLLQSRLTKDPILVQGEFLIDGKPLKIIRGKKTGLMIDYDGETVSGNVKLAEEKLQEIIGIPNAIFKKMVHKKQKEGGFFLNMTAKATYEFLTEMLGLDLYNKKLEQIKEEKTKISKNTESFEWKKTSLENDIKQIESNIQYLEKPKTSVNEQDILAIQNKVKELGGSKLSIDVEYSSRLSFLSEPEKVEVHFDDSKLKEIEAKGAICDQKLLDKCESIEALQEQLRKMPELKLQARHIGNNLAESKKTIESLKESICPTCKQNWATDSAKQKIKEINEFIKKSTQEALGLKARLEKEPSLQSELEKEVLIYNKLTKAKESIQKEWEEEKQLERDHKAKELADYNKQFAEFKQAEREIEKEHQSKVLGIERELQELKIELTSKQKDMDTYRAMQKKYEEDLGRLSQQMADKKQVLEALVKETKEDAEKLNVIAESERLIKMYILQTFQETLDTIGDQATQILSSIPNMASSTIYFEGCKENKDGSIKNEVNGIINMDGEDINIKSLSGGERTSIDLAVDLALIDVIESKVGKGANFYIIDEPFDGLDAVCRENTLELLSQLDTNKQIIMVDHSSELKEMVSETITVVRDGETSIISM